MTESCQSLTNAFCEVIDHFPIAKLFSTHFKKGSPYKTSRTITEIPRNEELEGVEAQLSELGGVRFEPMIRDLVSFAQNRHEERH